MTTEDRSRSAESAPTPAADDVSEARHGERCMDCGQDYRLWWADSPLFHEVIGGWYGPSLLCPDCFDKRAAAKGIALMWQPRRWDSWAKDAQGDDVREAIKEWRRSPEYRAETNPDLERVGLMCVEDGYLSGDYPGTCVTGSHTKVPVYAVSQSAPTATADDDAEAQHFDGSGNV